MTLQEFHEYLKTQDIEDKIVHMRYKYSWEDEWTYSNEILEVDMSVDGYYIWNNDWDEGQDEIQILGCVSVSDIDVPDFEIPRKSTLCKDCEHFHIDYEPQKIGGQMVDFGRASCKKHNLVTDFRTHSKFETLSCVEESENNSK